MQATVSPQQPASPSERDMRIALALMASLALHGIALSTQFTLVNARIFDDQTPALEMVLVNTKSRTTPLKPDVLAQANLAGGGNVDDDRRAKSPLPASKSDVEARPDSAQERVRQLEEQARQLMTQLNKQPSVETSSQVAPRRDVDSTDLMRQASEMAKLQAQIAKQQDEYQKRPRRDFVGANARYSAYAQYIMDWIAKVERIGNNNYPEAARRQRIYGSVRLTVSIFSDGKIESVEVEGSSANPILKQAAINIVNMGSPYAPFPREMREAIWKASGAPTPYANQGGREIAFSITRTWIFTRSDQLSSED